MSAAVADAKRLLADIDSAQMRIGELADQVAKVYREERLKRFADDIESRCVPWSVIARSIVPGRRNQKRLRGRFPTQ